MKLTIELKEKEFEFSYDFGEGERCQSTMPIGLDSLRLFVGLCDKALISRERDLKKKFEEISLRAFIETDRNIVKKWLEDDAKRKGIK